ncbi:MAG: NADH-quinone oxidoreductase subunit NuoB [Holosporales bacterium]|jgi:NADH-quinone oxidoreductase subunit B|nr:NADH-quinone oxidoreductase subunit NuoB [Holosporales bacterium]
MKNHLDVFFSSLQRMSNWASQHSLWPFSFGISCCAIEMMHAAASRIDLDRYGCLFRPSPKQSDLMIIAGSITKKMADQIINLYNQMLSPKYVIAMGSCAISGGLYDQSYSIVNGTSNLIPVDVIVPGCPPAPEDLAAAILTLQKKIWTTRI